MGDTHQPFRRVRLDAHDYVWLRASDIRSVGWLDGQVLVETETQTFQRDPDGCCDMRTPEQILADAHGEHALADCIPYVREQIWALLERRRKERGAVDYLVQQRATLLEEIARLKAERARHGLSFTGESGGELALTGKE